MIEKTTGAHDSITIINKKKKELAIFSVFTLSVLIILLVFAVRPMLVSITKTNSEIQRKEVLNRQLEQKITNLEILRNQYYGFEDDLEDLTLVYPNNWDFSLFVSNIEQLCNQNNFRLLSIRLDKFDSQQDDDLLEFEKLDYWSTDIRVRGRQDNLIHLFEDIENLPMYSTVDKLTYEVEVVDFDTLGGERDHDLIEFVIGGRLYYVNDPNFYNLFDF
jgi:Tfp pilus assembly protein PilO